MKVHYRFRHEIVWTTIPLDAPIPTATFLEIVRRKTGVKVRAIDHTFPVVRPHNWIVLAKVPKHWPLPPITPETFYGRPRYGRPRRY